MKNRLSILVCSFLLMALSCKKEESKIHYEGGTAPILTASATAVTLEPGPGQEATALVLNWTNPDYQFTTGLSSQDVRYTIEFDTLGGNFSSGKKFSPGSVSKDLSKVFTVAELNGILGNDMQLQLSPRRNYTIQVRIISSIGGTNATKLTSNAISFTTKPFSPPPKVAPPDNETLWPVGDAISGPSAWSNPIPAPYDVSQKFTKLSSTLYELTVAMTGTGGYKIIQVQGDWSKQYHALAGGTWESGSFEKADAEPKFPSGPSAGNYKITLNFQNGTYTVVKL